VRRGFGGRPSIVAGNLLPVRDELGSTSTMNTEDLSATSNESQQHGGSNELADELKKKQAVPHRSTRSARRAGRTSEVSRVQSAKGVVGVEALSEFEQTSSIKGWYSSITPRPFDLSIDTNS